METEVCTNCSSAIGKLETAYLFNGNVICGVCDQKLRSPVVHQAPAMVIPIQTVVQAQPVNRVFRSSGFPTCHLCGSEMVNSKVGRHPILRLIINLSMIFWGLILTIFGWLTIILPIIGITMILLAIFRQGKRKKVLKCTQCGAIADRG